MISKIDHIAIAVENLDAAIALYEKTLGLQLAHRESVGGYDVETATFRIGDTAIELVEGKTEESSIRKYVQTKGPGIHHIAFAVDNIQEAIAKLKSEGARLVDDTPRPGKEGSLVAFIHPKSTEKILYEIVQPARKE
jgi:methylmalonyl-CoA/ethylmalonyl-CoA epimerase